MIQSLVEREDDTYIYARGDGNDVITEDGQFRRRYAGAGGAQSVRRQRGRGTAKTSR